MNVWATTRAGPELSNLMKDVEVVYGIPLD